MAPGHQNQLTVGVQRVEELTNTHTQVQRKIWASSTSQIVRFSVVDSDLFLMGSRSNVSKQRVSNPFKYIGSFSVFVLVQLRADFNKIFNIVFDKRKHTNIIEPN